MTAEVTRVSEYENESVKGHALCGDIFWSEHIEKVTALRERQSKYQASLPVDPAEAVSAARNALGHDGETGPKGLEEALHLSIAIQGLANGLDIEDHTGVGSLKWLASRMEDCLREARNIVRRVDDILGAKVLADFDAKVKSRREILNATQHMDDVEKQLFTKALSATVTKEKPVEEAISQFKEDVEKHRANKEKLLAS